MRQTQLSTPPSHTKHVVEGLHDILQVHQIAYRTRVSVSNSEILTPPKKINVEYAGKSKDIEL